VAYAAKERGVSPLRIALESTLLRRGRGKLTLDEYFLAGAWRPGLSFAERRAFLGPRAYVALNTALNPPAPNGPGTALADKLACHARFSAAGLPQPRILAVATADKPVTGEDWLSSPAATLAFLARPGALPDFGLALALACAAHAAFPEQGIVGSDIFLSDRGPLITEINGNPHHSCYQEAHLRGMLNADHMPRLRALRDRFCATVPRPKDCPLK